MQMIRVYIADPTIDRKSDPLKWWADSGAKLLAPVAKKILVPICILQPACQASASSVGLFDIRDVKRESENR